MPRGFRRDPAEAGLAKVVVVGAAAVAALPSMQDPVDAAFAS